MNELLKRWVSESESWQSFIDFNLPEDTRAKYPFIERADDFYLSLMHRCYFILKEGSFEDNSEEMIAIAKGLEIYSLEGKKKAFRGVNESDNMLYASALYYLANFSASAWILANIYPHTSYSYNADRLVSVMLKRKFDEELVYSNNLHDFLKTGDFSILSNLKSTIDEKLNESFESDSSFYSSNLLARAILNKFTTENIWHDLLEVNSDPEYWKPFVDLYVDRKVPIWSFFPSQKKAIQRGILTEQTFSLQMPTSSGKTSISELVIYNEIKGENPKKILYLAPFRALASELKKSLGVNLGKLGVKSKTIYGGNIPSSEERNTIQEADLLISTPEKFMAIEDVFPGIHREFGTIICDEGHLLDDSSRGLSYELLLSRLKEDTSVHKKFLFISAIIPNIDVINSWLGGNENTLITSSYRPTELEYAFVEKMRGSSGYLLNINPIHEQPRNYQLYKYLISDELKMTNPEDQSVKRITSKKGITAAVSIKATNSGSVAVFAPHKRGNSGVEGITEEIVTQLEWKNNTSLISTNNSEYIGYLVQYFSVLFGEEYLLNRAARNGLLYHHGDFPQGVREIIEETLRKGKINLVVCTNTLAEGVNLPIKTMVIHGTRRFNPSITNWEWIKKRDIKNLVGRAGRAGKETKGLVIIPHSSDFEHIKDLIRESEIEPVKGTLYNIVKEMTRVLSRQRLQLTNELLEAQNESFQILLDSIDVSVIDLLGEEINSEQLGDIVQGLISQTLSYDQSNEGEKETLKTLFSLRAEKLNPYIETGDYRTLRNSGASLRLFDDIQENINFNHEIWRETINPLDATWLDYILDECLFKLDHFHNALAGFNGENSCSLTNTEIKQCIREWMEGAWYKELGESLGLQIHQVLRLINSLISFSSQSMISTVIRMKELQGEENTISDSVTNWPTMLQHGISTKLELDLFEMGLIDRVAVKSVSEAMLELKYNYVDYNSFRSYIFRNQELLMETISNETPKISLSKIGSFLRSNRYSELL